MNSHHDFFCTVFALWVYVPSLMMGPSSGIWNPFLLSGWGEMQIRQIATEVLSILSPLSFFPHVVVSWQGVVSECQLVSVDVFNRKPVLL